MKNCLCFALWFFAGFTVAQKPAPRYLVEPIPFHLVKLSDQFWAPRMETVRSVTIPHTFLKNAETGRVKSFQMAGGLEGGICTAFPFDDSDVYKSIEGAANSLRIHPDKKLAASVDSLIAIIAAAQEADGYIYTWRTIADRNKKQGLPLAEAGKGRYLDWLNGPRWANVDKLSHELYNAGHLYEAAVAWKEATGKRNLLDIALKNAALIEQNFGPGKLKYAPGHQEIEIGLVKLYLSTGEQRWLNLAKFFLDVRGYGEPYSQNHKKIQDQRTAEGHAVRLGYMFMAAADVTALTGSQEYLPAMKAVWEDIVRHKMYLTGGVGATGSNEGFGAPYDLPNYSAYCETCSSIAFVWWTQKMFQLTGDSRYVDVLELTLYNALNAGLSLSGNRFFYPNPLESRKNVERSEWFSCSCCPPNLTRFFEALPGLFYAKNGNDLYVNLFGSSQTIVENINSKAQKVRVAIRQETEFPWSGQVKIHVEPAKPNSFALKMRIPGWAKGDAVPFDLYRFHDFTEIPVSIKINGKVAIPKFESGYAVLDRKWQMGDVVELSLPMPVQRVQANDRLEADAHCYALKRGPLVYCLEGKDQPDDRVGNLLVPDSIAVGDNFDRTLLGGVQTLSLHGYLVKKKKSPNDAELQQLNLKAIPYYSWANRGKDNMLVWLPNSLRGAKAIATPSIATQSIVTSSAGAQGELASIVDQFQPQHSADGESTFVHWWPKFGTAEWLQYDFKQAEQIGTVRVYWFDDEAKDGGCRVPKSWRLMYFEDGKWKAVHAPEGFTIVKDGWSEVQFEPVKTAAVRLEMQLQEGVSTGVHEWQIH